MLHVILFCVAILITTNLFQKRIRDIIGNTPKKKDKHEYLLFSDYRENKEYDYSSQIDENTLKTVIMDCSLKNVKKPKIARIAVKHDFT